MSVVDWTFGGMWPYEPCWFDTPDGRLHYIDEGPSDGPPVVLFHGNPTWGFLYRNFVGPLTEAGYRVIVPDFLGFGRSDKPADPDLYRTNAHVERLNSLLDSLDLHNATVVPQDWGALGLSWAAAHPERVSRLFILNSSIHNPEKFNVPTALKFFRMPGVGEVMVKGFSMFHHAFLFKAGMVNRNRLTKEIRQAYLAPHATWGSRTGVLEFPREIPIGPVGPIARLLLGMEEKLRRNFRDRPVRIVWGMNDVAFTEKMLEEEWMKNFPQAKVVRLDGAGHYLQEDAHERIIPELLDFLHETDEVESVS